MISASELKIMKDGKINFHHYIAHNQNSAHNVEILNAEDVNLGWRA